DGARFIAQHYRPGFLIVGEPNRWDRLALGYKGSAWAQVTLQQSQAHTASGEQTAAEAAVAMWLGVRAFAEAFNAEKSRAFDKLLLTLRGIESGEDGFAQWARLKIGARLPLDLPPDAWYQQLEVLTAGAQVEPLGFAIPAWACDKNTPLVRAFLRAIRSRGGAPSFVYKTGTADLNIVAPLWQCPAVVYGPGDSALDHTPNEHLSLEEYAYSVDVVSEALSALVNVS
ncbi:MAG: M20/M25/M40 family metallo-hydrolase, partial [Anaerolineales bacterium]